MYINIIKSRKTFTGGGY